jgi:CBS domain-containing protein
MKVKDVMVRPVETVTTRDTVQEAAQKMKTADVGVLPVYERGELVGMITDRDIVINSTAVGHDPRITGVDASMHRGVEWCSEEQDLEEAATIMKEKKVRRLPVFDNNRHLVGIVSLGDIAASGDEILAGEAFETITEEDARR